MNFVVGLSGGIGSGKSTVADLFATLGAAVVDTDVIAHELTGAQGAAMSAIAKEFGQELLCADGALDRAAMRRLVFSDPSSKNRLEAILHPMIRRESKLRCQTAQGAPYVVLVVPLLVESGAYRELLDRVLVVDCDEAVQVSRVVSRSGFSVADVQAIMSVQASRSDRLAAADNVILNNEDRENLVSRILVLHQYYLELASLGRNAEKLNAKH